MTASLLVFVPVALLFLIGAFCFVGCVLDTKGHGLGFTQYSDLDVIKNPNCIHFWPLSDSPGQTTALDVVGKNNNDERSGTYKSVNTDPSLFPCPAVELSPVSHSAAAPGTVTLGASGILFGDTLPPHDPNNPTYVSCAQVDGGFVTVPVSPSINPPVPFTIEVWCRPEWSEADDPAFHMVYESVDAVGNDSSGYGLWVNEEGKWQALVGAVGVPAFELITGGAAALNAVTHVVLTCDGDTASLFVDGVLAAQKAVAKFVPNTTQPLVFGVGFARLPQRTQPSDQIFFPLVPFKGKLQNIAMYNTVLSDLTIMNHYQHGMGNAGE